MRFILPLILLIFTIPGLSQETRQVECRFLSFGSNSDIRSVIALADGEAEVTCPLSSSNLSAKITCTAKDNTIRFLSEKDRKPIANARIKPNAHSVLLVFVRTPNSAEKAPDANDWRIFVIDDTPKNFPDGGAYIANFHPNNIRFIIGEHKGMLRAAGAHGYAMPKERDDFNMAPVIFEFLQGDRWRIANESSLRFLPGMRYLIFAYVDPVSGRPRINTYQDFAAPTAISKTP